MPFPDPPPSLAFSDFLLFCFCDFPCFFAFAIFLASGAFLLSFQGFWELPCLKSKENNKMFFLKKQGNPKKQGRGKSGLSNKNTKERKDRVRSQTNHNSIQECTDALAPIPPNADCEKTSSLKRMKMTPFTSEASLIFP